MVFFEIFPWDKNFETGIELIDKQHKQLVDILNKLAAHLANNSNDIVLNEIFDELASYADYHFKDEEKIWDEHFGDDEWNTEHHKTHGSFIGEVLKIKENKENKSLDVVVHDIVSYLSKWLAYHILDTDKRLSIAVREIKSGTKIEEAKIVATQEMNGSLKVIVDTVLSMYETLSSRTLNLMREKSLRRKAEEALKITEERLKLVIEDDSEDIWDWDLQDNILSKSLTKESINYIANNYLNETKNNSTIHPTDIQQVKDDLQNHINGKTEFYTNKHRLLHPDGSWSWILSRGKVVKRNSDGKALRMIGTNTDITERELASLIHKKSSQAMYICDSNKKIISVNPSFTNITGYTKEDAIGKEPNFMSQKDHTVELYKQIFETATDTGKWSGKVFCKRKNGENFIEYAEVDVVRDAKGNIDHYIILFNDITEEETYKQEQKEREEYLLHQSRMAQMGEMIGMIAHQWKQPLTIISTMSNQARVNYELGIAIDPEEQNESAKTTQTQVEYLSQTIDDFKNFLKPSKKKELTKISDVFDESTHLIGKLIKSNNINISTNINSQSYVEIYPKELLQVFINLFKNSVDAFKEKNIENKNLTITTNEDSKFITIEVTDNAGGIKEEVINSIFDPYITTKSEKDGTGLGLHICKTIVIKRLNGDITVKNTEDGARFTITIPKL